jgi:hypothetical protein
MRVLHSSTEDVAAHSTDPWVLEFCAEEPPTRVDPMLDEVAASLVLARAPAARCPPLELELAQELEVELRVSATEVEGQGGDAADDQVRESTLGRAPGDLYAGLFRELPPPILPAPPMPTMQAAGSRAPRARKPKRDQVPTRSSLRQAARPSNVPVAQRAQLKLMRELDFINGGSSATDAAVVEYIDSFGQDLPDEAVKALRAAAKLDDMELCKTLAAIAAESGTDTWEFPC